VDILESTRTFPLRYHHLFDFSWLSPDWFDNGLMGGFFNGKVFYTAFHKHSPTSTGLIVAILEVGAFFGSVFTAFLESSLEEERVLHWPWNHYHDHSSYFQATAYTRAQLLVAQTITRFGLNAISSSVPVLQAQFAPKATRGLFTDVYSSSG